MNSVILGGLAAGAVTVLICTSAFGAIIRKKAEKVHSRLGDLVNCCLCTSVWVSCAMLDKFSFVDWMATVTIANISVLLIHLSAATMGDEDGLIQEVEGQETT